MKNAANIPLVTTIKEHCRVCYTCVRECPAKAIRIVDGQAEVISERCVGCGNCVRVCSQHAKQMLNTTSEVEALLSGSGRVAACVAPSFPVDFHDGDFRHFASMVRALGFDLVTEVAFGADLVAKAYSDLLEQNEGNFIATTCPAIVAFIERYHPELVASLAPIVSPMVAVSRVLRQQHGEDLAIVFIGPCIAKKGELASAELHNEVNAALTFSELHEMFTARNITADSVEPGDFDPPRAGAGALFPISRGLLQAANIQEDVLEGNVLVADGRAAFGQAIREFEAGDCDVRLLEVLACHGCIMGPGTVSDEPQLSRRRRVRSYVKERMAHMDENGWEECVESCAELDLSRKYLSDDQRIAVPSEEELIRIMARMGKFRPTDELNCGACGYETCREHAIAIHKGLAESEMCLPYTIEELGRTINNLAVTDDKLAETKVALVQSEKLASMGQLAAGIAHELNNPLGIVLMYAHILKDEFGKDLSMLEDLTMITEQADRCKKIVAGLLHFARQNKVVLEPVDVLDVVKKSLAASPAPEKVELMIENELDDTQAELDRDQVIQVLTNLIGNGIAAMTEGGTLTVRISGDDVRINIAVKDTGTGIPQENLSRIFDPFFTTKQLGAGTGLGLAVAYGIVKMHRGDISVESNADPASGPTGTTFTMTFPRGRTQPEDASSMPVEIGEDALGM